MKVNNKPFNFKKHAIAGAVSTAILFSGSYSYAYAEQQQQADKKDDGHVTVTANRREQSVLEVPFNISAISGDMLTEVQITDSTELMRFIPGVAVVDRGHRNSGVINGIMIRGLNVDGSALGDYALSTVPTVSTYVNDTPVYANFILKDINRVEVLRGPQGTLYGSGSLGGTVKYILNEPVIGEFEGQVSLGFSSTDGSDGISWETHAILNMPIAENAALRFVGGKTDMAGIVDYKNIYQLDANRIPVAPDGPLATTAVYDSKKDADTVDITHARISLLLEPNDDFSALLSYQTQSDDIGGRRQQTLGSDGWGEEYDDYENGSIMLEPSSRDVELMSLEMDLDLGFATLTSSTSNYEHEGDSISENTGFYAQNNWLANFYYNYPRPMAEAQRTYADEAFVQELRLVSNTDGDYDYILGAYYQDQDRLATQNSYLRGFKIWADTAWGPCCVVSDNDFAYQRDENFEELSFFGELTYRFTEKFRMTAGIRSFEMDSVNNTDMMVGLYTSFSPQDSSRITTKDTGTLYKSNFSYDLSEDHMLYGTWSEGYRRGGSNAVPTTGIFAEDPRWRTYTPDEVTNYELGIKGTQGSMRYNLSAFKVDWEDIQLNVATTNWGFFAVLNGGKAETSGIELELNGYFGNDDSWEYAIGYAYVDAELTEDVVSHSGTVLASDGNRLPGTPENTLNASLSHTQELDSGWYWINRVGLYYQSDSENYVGDSVRFQQEMDSFSMLDVNSTLSMDEWTLSLWIKNLTNEKGSTGVFKEEYMGTSPSQNYFGNGSKEFIALPRTIGVTVNYSF